MKKFMKKAVALTLVCTSVFCSVGKVEAANNPTIIRYYSDQNLTVGVSDLTRSKGTVSIRYRNDNSSGAFSGQIHLAGTRKGYLQVTVEAYYFRNANERKNRKNVINYNKKYTVSSGAFVGAGGETVSYPLCNSGYPCRALANVDGNYAGKAEIRQ